MRCIVECTSQHDCISGTHCATTHMLGQCFIDQPRSHTDSPCAPGRPCVDPAQLCRDFTCWDHCTTAADCERDSTCRFGACANPVSPGSGYGVHRPCSATLPCATGEICATDHGSAPACRRTCRANSDCTDVEVTPLCASIDDPTQPAGTMACVIGCDPVRQLGCINRDRCEADIATGAGGTPLSFFECRATVGTGIAGVACGTTVPMLDRCAAYLGCAPTSVDMSAYQCRRFCLLDGDCMDPMLHCTGLTSPSIANANVVNTTLHMCAP